MWDYVYSLSRTNRNQGPYYWAIGATYEPDVIYSPVGGWTGIWDDGIGAGEYGDHFVGTALEGEPGVVWTWGGTGKPLTGTFHFQSTYEPTMRSWVAWGTTEDYSGAGEQWSASPEPAGMALTALTLLGVGYWRWQRTRSRRELGRSGD